jgi:putative FmdB family regulatory protein
MPIYEYRCNSCGFEKEHLQKINDAPISICPACGSNDYSKLISAAGFQLKGSGWYVTDFKNNKTEKTASKQATKSETATESTTKPVDTSANTDTKTSSTAATD